MIDTEQEMEENYYSPEDETANEIAEELDEVFDDYGYDSEHIYMRIRIPEFLAFVATRGNIMLGMPVAEEQEPMQLFVKESEGEVYAE